MAKQLPGWDQVFNDATLKIGYMLKIIDVKISFWAMGRSEEEIVKEARRRLQEEKGIEYPEPQRVR